MANKMVFTRNSRTIEIELFEEDVTQHKWSQFVDAGRLHDPKEQSYLIPCKVCGHGRGRVFIHAKNGTTVAAE